MTRVSFYTLGCKLNYAETQSIQQDFERRDFEVVPFGAPADISVINTCTVTRTAEAKARKMIRRAVHDRPDTFVIVTGCYAQLRPEELAAIDGVDVVLGAQEKFRLFAFIDSFAKPEQTQVHVSCIDDADTFGPAASNGERTRAFLKVQDGCDYSCSFCTIPKARGPSRSQSIEATVAQARKLVAAGYTEIVLTGINIGLFGQDHDTPASFFELIQALDGVDRLERARISSIEPNLLTDEIIAFVAESDTFQPHFHIPLQSGDNDVLGAMRRRYQRDVYADRVATIREHMPDAGIGCDVIAGFPAEDEARFENSYRFINNLPVTYLHVFTYSERPGTAAVDQPERTGGSRVPQSERSRRNKMLRTLSKKKEHAFAQSQADRARPVLWEAMQENGFMYGYTDNYIRVRRGADPQREGMIEDVRLGALNDDGTVQADDAAFIPLH
ncbi:MAG: tRNA (N(6)-L-threonylcarbamoyladenosine(37)-C(2))-methylthiotransferase MtaB [Bacteroidetes bacterium]|jgi:threonylcarbamoyladenosine tRNA methylthiotransferase MtaB|nr:tRNA (N(6)-L-threonylcarbamoyladenosine(37)-C(2))-methylthiotransferase MtaB [Bacteroidota bacterium]